MYQFDKNTPLGKNLHYFVKWSAISVIIGLVTGLVGTAFGHAVLWVSAYFRSHPWTILFLPVCGLLITGVYHLLKEDKNRGTNMVIESIYSGTEITFGTAPAVFIGTLLTHIAGGSSGREGAALQMGGSIGNQIGKALRLDEKDIKIAVMCGMSGAFAALFGTPVAAAVFSMEVISIGVMYYAALVPCIFSAYLGAAVAKYLGLHPEAFPIGAVPEFGLKMGVLIVILGILCALVAELFCIVLHGAGHLYVKHFPSPAKRIAMGGLLVIVLTLVSRNIDYNGSGIQLIEKCFEGEVDYTAFLWKILFTAVTLEAGFKGGEIVPTLTIGATFGCTFAMLTGQPHGLMAASGMLALFVGVTNCPITTLLLGLELFGYSAMPYFVVIIAVSFTLSGYYSLYSSQKFVYSKTKTEYINRKTNDFIPYQRKNFTSPEE
ncbi:chloride channel protein [uncultured Clostridium sp.]|uniref:chloride channel protein n=1 Tax=uncultured Clostridium sp. TaxID=59620 RepID=UPI0025EBDFC8|nr:chloride channel protein [uncultured Clostridium sp.]